MSDLRDESERYAALLDRSERLGGAALDLEETAELGRLHRRHTARLAQLRARGDDPVRLRALNALCVRGHTLVARVEPTRGTPRAGAAGWLVGALAATWRTQLVAWALLGTGVVMGGALGGRDVRAVHALFPCVGCMGYTPAQLDRLATSPGDRAVFFERRATSAAGNSFFGSRLFAHNTRVGLLGFAAGLLAGVPTAVLLLYNGIILGAFGSVFFRDPLPLDFLAWILPHGVPEFTAIVLSSAGGLVLGGAVVAPGRGARVTAVRAAIPHALALFVASVPLFLVAALVESFVRESALGLAPRFAVAGVNAAAIAVGLAFVARAARAEPARDTGWLAALIAPPRGGAPDSAPAPPS